MSEVKSPLDIIKGKAEETKKLSISIPSGATVSALLYAIDYTNKGRLAAQISKGICLKFAYLDYTFGVGANAKKVTCIDYSDLKNVHFPIDRKNPDNTIDRPGLIGRLYFSEGTIRAKNMNPIDTDFGMAVQSAFELGRQFGDELSVAYLSVLANSGLCKLTASELGLDKFREDYPVVTTFRYTDMVYEKKDKNKDGTIMPGAKKVFSENLTTYEYATKSTELSKYPLRFLDAETVTAIAIALNKRQEDKKADAIAKAGPANAMPEGMGGSYFDGNTPF
jgi:hypothetical protein